MLATIFPGRTRKLLLCSLWLLLHCVISQRSAHQPVSHPLEDCSSSDGDKKPKFIRRRQKRVRPRHEQSQKSVFDSSSSSDSSKNEAHRRRISSRSPPARTGREVSRVARKADASGSRPGYFSSDDDDVSLSNQSTPSREEQASSVVPATTVEGKLFECR